MTNHLLLLLQFSLLLPFCVHNMRVCFFCLFVVIAFVPATACASVDSDGDGFFDAEELRIGTDANLVDTDGDGFDDYTEVSLGFSPLKKNRKMSNMDSDADGLRDDVEYKIGTQLTQADSDNDGFSDGIEIRNGFDPLRTDPMAKVDKKLVVDRTVQQMTVYIGSVPVYLFPVSTGVRGAETPKGSFSIFQKIPVMRYVGPGYDLPGVKWNLHFKKNYFIHTAYWHDNFGQQPMSHGCINMREKDARVVYDLFGIGSQLEVIGDTPIIVAKK